MPSIPPEFLQNARFAGQDLPLEVFHRVSELTPLINVDLLISNDLGQTLLTWRDDEFYGPGWHIPGGIIRFKETIDSRINKVAAIELKTTLSYDPVPMTIIQLIDEKRSVRGHFISLLYRCRLVSPPATEMADVNKEIKAGQWLWHDDCPENIILEHEIYAQFFSV